MNKMLIAIFANETAADAGLHALRRLHAEGDITLYATGVIAKDAAGGVHIKEAIGQGPVGTGVGLAVGSLIGLLGGPVGVVVGATTGTVLGAIRDFWVAGVGLDFVEEAEKTLQPGTVALVAEIEEEWGIPVDSALEAMESAVERAKQRVEVLKMEADAKAETLKVQLSEVTDKAKTRLEDRLQRVKHAYHARGAKLSQAWSLTKAALTG